MTVWALFVSVFLACSVEAVEATTIVLAAGAARDWRSALIGLAAAVVVLAVAVIALGPAIGVLPIQSLRLFVGGFLLVFGMQWLRKAVLRAGGYQALHNEDEVFRKQLAEARAASTRSVGLVADWYAFTLSFKGVLLEGLEVVFIVLTFGSNEGNIPVAGLAAGAAIVVVAAAGALLRAPLGRVPENSLKFIVGTLLTSFGIFWGAEGAGAQWPGSDAALLVLIPLTALLSFGLVALLRLTRQRSVTMSVRSTAERSEALRS
jgi:uncharacterized membrane protein